MSDYLSDDDENNIIAAGALWMALITADVDGLLVTPEFVDGNATNKLVVAFDFLKSPYRITIERIVAPEEDLLALLAELEEKK